jgi:hypothetical protein
MNIKNIIIFFSLMLITTIINKHYMNLFILELDIKNNILIPIILSFITSKLADNINNIN